MPSRDGVTDVGTISKVDSSGVRTAWDNGKDQFFPSQQYGRNLIGQTAVAPATVGVWPDIINEKMQQRLKPGAFR